MKSEMNSYIRKKKILCAIGRTADLILFTTLTICALSMLFRGTANGKAILILSALAVLIVLLLLDRITHKRKERNELTHVCKEIRTEKLLLMSDERIEELTGERTVMIRESYPEKAQILHALIRHPKYLICLGNEEIARELIRCYALQTTLLTVEEAIERTGIECSMEEAKGRMQSRDTRIRRHVDVRQLFQNGWNRYLVLGLLLLVLSVFTSHKIYYRLLASVSLILSVFQGVLRLRKRSNIFRFFLDNMER